MSIRWSHYLLLLISFIVNFDSATAASLLQSIIVSIILFGCDCSEERRDESIKDFRERWEMKRFELAKIMTSAEENRIASMINTS